MSKSFEEIALDIVKLYIDSKKYDSEHNGNNWQMQYDYSVNDVHSIANTVTSVANTLADNYRHRAVNWDEQNFEREVEKMLTTQENIK